MSPKAQTTRRRTTTAARDRPPARTGDEGQIMLLAMAYGLLALLLVGVVVSATAVHLERKRLLVLADLAALEAADAIDVPAYYAEPPAEAGAVVRVEPVDVTASVEELLATAPEAARFTDLVVVEATTTDSRTVHVTLRATAHVPLLSVVMAAWSEGIELVVTAQARAG